jgi:predicted  nucleic acid-binding Zn-ribbon protein
MKSTHPDIWHKLRRAKKRLEFLSREFQSLESEKRGYLQEIMKGGQLSNMVKEAGQAIKEKGLAISKVKGEVGNLRSLFEGELARFRKELIEEKQGDLNRCMEERTRYLGRIEELEVEISRYRYLVTGKKDRHLVEVENPLPLEVSYQDDFQPIDEVIGHIKVEIHKIICMSSEELLKEYLARRKKHDQNP